MSSEYECPHCQVITKRMSNILRCPECRRAWTHPENVPLKGRRSR